MTIVNDLKGVLVVDVETSGLDPYRHQLLSIAIVPAVGDRDPLVVYVRHMLSDINWQATGRSFFNKYYDDWTKQAVLPFEACEKIAQYVRIFGDEITLAGHNIAFDYSFLKQLFNAHAENGCELGASHRLIDTHTLLKVLQWRGKLPININSSTKAFQHFEVDVPTSTRHTALADALATRLLLTLLHKELK